MKKMFVLAIALFSVVLIMGTASFRSIPSFLENEKTRKTCVGYTIIAFDKGVDCNGDTVTLIRRKGFAERADF